MKKQYVIVAFLRLQSEPIFKRTSWPLHLTILGPFFTNHEFMVLADKMRAVCNEHKPMTLVGKERRKFGRRNDVPATTVERTPELHQLHTKLLERLSDTIELKVLEHSGRNYAPHVSDRMTSKLKQGETITLNSLSLVELLDDKGIIVANAELI